METAKTIASFFLNGYLLLLGIVVCTSALLVWGWALLFLTKTLKKLLKEESI